MGEKFRSLSGLPTTGPAPVQFSATGQGMHSEGYVVEFRPSNKNTWVGVFQGGLSEYNAVAQHPNGKDVVVIASGEAYVIDPATKQAIATFGGTIHSGTVAPELPALVFDDGISILILHTNGKIDQTDRISWDGIREIQVRGTELTGEAYNPMMDCWHSFRVELLEATFEGGSYSLHSIG